MDSARLHTRLDWPKQVMHTQVTILLQDTKNPTSATCLQMIMNLKNRCISNVVRGRVLPILACSTEGPIDCPSTYEHTLHVIDRSKSDLEKIWCWTTSADKSPGKAIWRVLLAAVTEYCTYLKGWAPKLKMQCWKDIKLAPAKNPDLKNR